MVKCPVQCTNLTFVLSSPLLILLTLRLAKLHGQFRIAFSITENFFVSVFLFENTKSSVNQDHDS